MDAHVNDYLQQSQSNTIWKLRFCLLAPTSHIWNNSEQTVLFNSKFYRLLFITTNKWELEEQITATRWEFVWLDLKVWIIFESIQILWICNQVCNKLNCTIRLCEKFKN